MSMISMKAQSMDPDGAAAMAVVAEGNQEYQAAITNLTAGLTAIEAGVLQIDIANTVNVDDKEEIIKLTASLLIPGLTCTQRQSLLASLAKISPDGYIITPRPAMPHHHIIKLLKQTLEKYPSLKNDNESYCNFCTNFIRLLRQLPTGVSRFMAVKTTEEILGHPKYITNNSDYFAIFHGVTGQLSKTLDDVHRFLDSANIRINRDRLIKAAFPSLPTPPIKTGQDVLNTFNRIIDSLNLVDSEAPNFLPLAVIDESAPTTADNRTEVERNIEKVRQYLRVLYDLPVTGPRQWAPKESEKPFLKKGIEVTLDALEHTDDLSVKANNTGLLIQGLIHCPAGQKEGIETVIKTVIYGNNAVSTSFTEQVKFLIAKAKEDTLEYMTRQPRHRENNHISASYRQGLSSRLGIFSSSPTYTEQTPVRTDDFEGDLDLVSSMFYLRFTPEHLGDILFNAVENQEDKRIKNEITSLKRATQQFSSDPNANKSKTDLREKIDKMKRETKPAQELQAHNMRIAQLEGLFKNIKDYTIVVPQAIERIHSDKKLKENQLKENQKIRPISVGQIVEYISNLYNIPDMTDEEQKHVFVSYFDVDNPHENADALLTKKGAARLLRDLNYIIDETVDWLRIKTEQESLSEELKRRRKERERKSLIDEFNTLRPSIEQSYREFKEEKRPKIANVSSSVQFLDSLVESLETAETYISSGLAEDYDIDTANVLAKKIAAILTQGHGVGGLTSRVATKEEQTILKKSVNIISKRMRLQDLELYINQGGNLATKNPRIIKHEQILWTLANISVLKENPQWSDDEIEMKAAKLLSVLVRGETSGSLTLPDNEIQKFLE
jgi:hypothetical protein